MAHQANRGREGTRATMVDGLSKGNKGWTTHTHMKILFEKTKNAKMQKYIYYLLPIATMPKTKKAMAEKGGV